MQRILEFSDSDKDLLLTSLPIIRNKLDEFVIKFYTYLLNTDSGRLFKETAMETQYRMFHSSLAIIITHVEHPALLEQHLSHLITSHAKYGVLLTDIDLFINSFMKTLQDIYEDQFYKYKSIWEKLITEIMNFFSEGLQGNH